jgi:CSLREA domain-containing protein
MRRVLALIGCTALGVVPAMALLASPAAAATFTADILTDEDDGACAVGDCSLREAVNAAAAAGGADDVVLGATGTYTLTLGALLHVSADALTVRGNGNTVTQGAAEVFSSPGAVTLLDIVTTGGDTGVSSGGAVTITGSSLTGLAGTGVSAAGIVTVTDSTLSGVSGISNGAATTVTRSQITASAGIGISSSGAVTVTDSTITSSSDGISSGDDTTVTRSTVSAAGLGISAPGVVMVTDSTVAGSSGGISNGDDTTVIRSLVTGGTGSGISNGGETNVIQSTVTDSATGISAAGPVTITNSTVTGNGSFGVSSQFVNLVYATITDNGAVGSAPQISASELTTFGSVVALPGGPVNCSVTTTTSQGYNYSDDATCDFTETGDVENGADPQLGALATNGGLTPTRLPATTSPLVEAIPAASCQDGGAAGITIDQRDLPRPGFTSCDIGAVELQAAPATLIVRFTG